MKTTASRVNPRLEGLAVNSLFDFEEGGAGEGRVDMFSPFRSLPEPTEVARSSSTTAELGRYIYSLSCQIIFLVFSID